MGLDTGSQEALVNVNLTVSWDDGKNDVFVKGLVRRTVETIEKFAEGKGTGYKWKYFNYCSEWQRPFEGYGDGAVGFLKGVSRKFDLDALF